MNIVFSKPSGVSHWDFFYFIFSFFNKSVHNNLFHNNLKKKRGQGYSHAKQRPINELEKQRRGR